MADQTELQIVVEAINKASATLNQVEKDLGGLNKSVQQQGETASVASMGFGQLVAAIATGTVVADFAASAFQKLVGFISELPTKFFDIVVAASEVEGLGIAMHVVANNAGITAAEVDKVRESIIQQNITTEAATRLITDLLRKEVDYKQALDLVIAAQNIAVASNMDSSEAVERISHAISTGNTFLLRELGIREDLNDVFEEYAGTLNKTTEELNAAEKAQAIVNQILKEGKKYVGAYDNAMGNAAKVLRSLERAQKEISYVFGSVFNDALNVVVQQIYKFADSVSAWADANKIKLKNIGNSIEDYMQKVVTSITNFVERNKDIIYYAFNFLIQAFQRLIAVQSVAFNSLQILAGGFEFMARSAIQAGKVIYAALKGDWEGVSKAGQEWMTKTEQITEEFKGNLQDIAGASKLYQDSYTFDLKKWWDNISNIETGGREDRLKEAEKGGAKLTKKQKDTLKKMQHDIEIANRDYQQAVEKRTKDFEQSLSDLVIEHRDKIKDLTEDLAKENIDYKKNLDELLADYNEAMDEIELRHKEKTKSIMDDMEDERKKAEEEIEKITEKYNQEAGLIKQEGEDRLSNLQTQLDKEKALGSNASQEKIEALEAMIAYEKAGLTQSLDDKQAVYDEEISDVNEKLDTQLEKLRASLEAEDVEYTKSFAKRKSQYEQDVIDAKASYEEKRSELQKELDEETAIRDKYAEDFKRIGDRMADDDITRLISTYNTEKAEMEREHQEKLADIKYQAFKGGEEFGNNLSSGLDSSYPAVKASVDRIDNEINEVLEKMSNYNQQISGFSSGFSGGGSGGGGGGSWVRGGLATHAGIVGEAGPEVVLPLNFPKRMAQIMQSLGMSGQGGGQVTQNFYVTVKNAQDVDLMMERAGFAMRTGGGYK